MNNKFNRKLNKLLNNPTLFFKDMYFKRKNLIRPVKSTSLNNTKSISSSNEVKSASINVKPLIKIDTGYKGKYQFAIICPTYNVEKYINEFFVSIENQILNFEKHIHIIFVDDGSTDSSAEIIAQLKNKYPNNITYLYKENGGLSSTRNYGLDYVRDNPNFDYVTFTDPDDFLNKEYFIELDKLFTKHPNCQIVSCNLIYFYEDKQIFKDIHPLKYRYSKTHIRKSADLGDDVLLSSATAVYKVSLLNELDFRFDEKVKPSFEDCKFNNQILTILSKNINIEIGFLKEANYFYRQREDNSSLMNGSWQHKGLFSDVLEKGVLNVLEFAYSNLGYVPDHIQRVALFHCIGYYRRLTINDSAITILLNKTEIFKFKSLLRKIFTYIDNDIIFKCEFPNLDKKIKVGLFGLYKKLNYPISYINLIKLDYINKKIIFSLNTGFVDDSIKIKLDGENIGIIEEKFTRVDFLGDDFYFDRIFAINYENVKQNLQIEVNGKKANIFAFTKGYTGGSTIIDFIKNMNQKVTYPSIIESIPSPNSWIIMDRKDKADDNAEHFYRYMMINHPEHNISFAISKDSSDWVRLEREGFNLIDYGSLKFKRELSKCKYLVSSHLFIWNDLIKQNGVHSGASKRKIWLQHGVICNDNSNVVNTKDIDLMITSTQNEYNSIGSSFTRYNLLPSQLILSGLPRHDELLKKNNAIPTEKLILVMPTWRTWLNLPDTNIEESEYFLKWNEFLSSKKLHDLLKKNGYTLIFSPHEEVQKNKDLFFHNDCVHIYYEKDSLQNLFSRAELMITDYSSVAFEMGFLKKIVIYFQFDKKEFFSNHYRKGYFDFENNGFGSCAENYDDLIGELENYFSDTPIYYKQYIENMNIFPNNIGNSCEKIFNKIMELN